ncbi:TPA: tyrosine-type recombinase/integrase [Vibrio parahaemolyticus]|uniref:integrase domain-containing protein n=1 Tax=Vibrio parahaemolyticus TaxID=670 RepID=UPI0011210CEB|nr:integrase domain-containing protein [Vibrio parahaemolyticus]EJA7342723.1 tyrosine-type recombinase/integrase [Vibrio parahaemolyticus]MDF4680033.1 integrase domain-containing protein [Vibrio parahaemolyticus]MDF4922528.1 integrase domain-containing protein [Vibrio parahaemolyticus]MEA5333366.1 integrase domain-containing protein [Vibrio parahaemolyticus]MEA5344108.1 integrase domain-containing protein [Vibrio parahaemolyticus]
MAKQVKPLTESQIKNAKPKAKEYTLSDGYGLRLRIKPNGTKTWLLNYTHPILSKRVNFTLGTYPNTSLKVAREKTREARELIEQSIDPKTHRDKQAQQEKMRLNMTLESVIQSWLEVKKGSVTSDHAEDIYRSLEMHVLPVLGTVPISEITPQLVIQALRPLERKGNLEVLRRVCQRLNEIMKFARNIGYIEINTLSDIKDAFRKPQAVHMKTLPPEALPELMRAVSRARIFNTTRCLIQWQLHTMVRPSEAAGARWEEIDWNRKLWCIPAKRMKKKRDHFVPLTNQTIRLLKEMEVISGNGISEYIFASHKDVTRPCCNSSVNMALKRMGFKGQLVSHGLRSLASTTLNEQPHFEGDLVEAALAHADKNKVRAAYNRSQYVEQRREMMQWWSDHIETSACNAM